MTRPSSHEDLRSYEREGSSLASISSTDALLNHPTVAVHLTAALAEAQRLGLSIKDGSIRTIPTAEELDARLTSRQEAWDRGQKVYLQYQEDGTFPAHRYLWSEYLDAEGIETPTKEADQ